MLSTMPRIW